MAFLSHQGFSFEDNSNDVFIQKEEFYRKFSFIYELSKKYKTMNTPMYLKFLMGRKGPRSALHGVTLRKTTLDGRVPVI